jgi:hypothetical protein
VAESHTIYFIGGRDDEHGVFTQQKLGQKCLLICEYRNKEISAEAPDFFEALRTIRSQLQVDGLIPYCYGASLNVYPSGMARDMGSGLKAYKLTIGERARSDDLVGIFETGGDIIPSRVEAQEEYFKDWLASLSRPA